MSLGALFEKKSPR